MKWMLFLFVIFYYFSLLFYTFVSEISNFLIDNSR